MKLTNYWVEALLAVLLVLSFWAVLSIQIYIIPKIEVNWTQEVCIRVNGFYLNLSYSIIAGFIIYLLTCAFPHYQKKRILKETMRVKMHIIVKIIDNVVLEFSREVGSCSEIDEVKLKSFLNSKVWTDNIPIFKQMNRISISYISFYCSQANYAIEQVKNLIQTYKDYLSTEQINSLEKWCNNQSFRDAQFWASIPNKNLEDPNGKDYLVEKFCEMYFEMKRIESMF